jgi:hypothetical protein
MKTKERNKQENGGNEGRMSDQNKIGHREI